MCVCEFVNVNQEGEREKEAGREGKAAYSLLV